MKKPISIFLGSTSDIPKIKSCMQTLDSFAVNYNFFIASAHRSAELLHEYLEQSKKDGVQVIIAAAGMSAHLAGVIASKVILPIISIPVAEGSFQGMDAVFSNIQMPGGIPLATMGTGSSGAKNAAVYAIEILALQDKSLAEKLLQYRKEMITKIDKENETISEKGWDSFL